MKKHFLLTTVLFMAIGLVRANTITVSNNLAHPSTYTDIQSAITASSKGDTIYVIGSLTNYGGIQINKFVHIFGPGIWPQQANALTAVVNGVEFQSGSDSTIVSGMVITQGCNFDNTTIYNLTLERDNLYSGGLSFSNGTMNSLKVISCFQGNGGIFISPGGNTFNNFLVENCIVGNDNGPLINGGFTSNTTIFKNNILIDNVNGGAGTYPIFGQVQEVTFSNNIFIGGEFNVNSSNEANYCTFDHNLAYLVTGSYGSDPFAYASNTSLNNIWDQNPNFEGVTLTNILLTNNYQLSPGSPCLTAASDGGQQGVYGGDPNANWSLATMPALPYIYSFLLTTATVNAGGSINATIISKAHN